MKIIKYLILFALFISLNGCNDNSDDAKTQGLINLHFTHNWDGLEVTTSDFNDLKFTNENGELMSISKLRYLVSNIILRPTSGENIELNGYILVDMSGTTSTIIANVPYGTYNSISFTFGFDREDNIDGAYADLNSVSWNWPEMLGGGYHFMQFEGKYDANGTESPFAYHMGTMVLPNGDFGQNFFDVTIDGFTMSNDIDINIEMNIAEWFKNPITWNLNTYDINLMPNFDAQLMMNQNGQSVFSLGEVSQ